MSNKSETDVAICWFRRDLRLEDQAALHHALKGDLPVVPIFIFDREILDPLPENDHRVTFIHQTLTELNEALNGVGSALKTYYDHPLDAWKDILEDYSVKQVYFNEDYEPYARERDEKVQDLLDEKDIEWQVFTDQVIMTPGKVLKSDDTPYLVYTPFSKQWKKVLKSEQLKEYSVSLKGGNWLEHDGYLHDLEEMDFKPSDIKPPNPKVESDVLDSYDEHRDIPSIQGTTRVSTELRFGLVSIRKLVKTAREENESWLNELIWREFFMHILYFYPEVVDQEFKSKYRNLPWKNDEEEFEKWKKGKTGFALVDAGMRELNETGYMHNRVRMLVASFLTKHLMIDWRWGEAYFAEKLFDYELASNNGNWQWAAGTGVDAAPYFRVFNPVRQVDRFDPNEKYIRKWVSEYGTDDYPEEMIDLKERKEECVERYKQAPYN
jgi:deoxyribodipyrimidine photo-lyase